MCAQTAKHDAAQGSVSRDLAQFVATPAVSGYESGLVKILQSKLAAFHPATDNLGDITVTIGAGAPHRLIATPMDEPGFVVSEITPDGYLRVQRLPQFVLPPIFNSLYSAQPVRVGTASGKWIDGVVAGLSVHLQPGHTNPPKSDDLENMYIDIGASSAAEARKAGVDLLSPIVINRQLGELGYARMAGASIGDRFGAAALVELLRGIDASKVKGTLTVAFVVQQWTGARGLQRILSTNQFDEMVYVGRLFPGGPIAGVENIHRAPRREPGSGVLIGVEKTDGSLEGLAPDLQHVAGNYQIPVQTDYSAGMIPPSYLPPPSMPAKWAHIGIAVAWPATPAELIDSKDLDALDSCCNSMRQSHMASGPSQAAGESPAHRDGASGPSRIRHPSPNCSRGVSWLLTRSS